MSKEEYTSSGALFLVATPIGNLEDISLRALRILKEVDLIACEDTRHTAKLLHHYGIGTPRESHHEHNEARQTARLLSLLREGKKIALVADAGTPLVSDPGYTLVAACRSSGIRVIPIPGPAAVTAALAASGLPTDNFFFAGFLPSRASARRKKLEETMTLPATLVFYEAPHRILAALHDMVLIFGPRDACLARELTKVHEEFICGKLPEIIDKLRERPRIQGEITLVVDRADKRKLPASWPVSIAQHLSQVMKSTGITRKEALKTVARLRGIGRNEAYRQLLKEESAIAPPTTE